MKLNLPTPDNPQETLLKAFCALPEIMERIAISLETVADYYESKGVQEGFFEPLEGEDGKN